MTIVNRVWERLSEQIENHEDRLSDIEECLAKLQVGKHMVDVGSGNEKEKVQKNDGENVSICHFRKGDIVEIDERQSSVGRGRYVNPDCDNRVYRV